MFPDIPSEWATIQPFESYFTCGICLNVVKPNLPQSPDQVNPSMCNICEKLTCQTCIEKWLKTSNDCPSCRQKYVAASRISRFTLNTLHSLEFVCGNCHKNFLYKDIQLHFTQECKSIILKTCPQ